MKAIRGAITVDKDNPEQIKQAVNELLSTINLKNSLKPEQITCIIFSSTYDLRSFYPAKAAREAGFSKCALFSSAEPKIKGALKKCIRVLILTEAIENDKSAVNVYLRKASVLRKDLTQILNIALDGPAGSGKSTVAKIIAEKLDILYLDTGAMYRACALKCLKERIDINNEESVNNVINNLDLQVKYENGVQLTYLDGKDVSEEIRSPNISMQASKVSAYCNVRNKMVCLQRKIAEKTSCILDGRDIGTNVLPKAEFKFYLTAAAEVRAQRRCKDNKERGFNQNYEEILKEIKKRDEQDKNREIAPLKQAEDAFIIDSSDMTVNDVVRQIINKIQEKI